MQQLTDIYGHCIIPKNTLLFRGHKDSSVDDCMFFATNQWVAGAFNETIQVWKTKTDIQILFLVDYLNDRSWTISAFPQLVNSIFLEDTNSEVDYLDIKQKDINKRNKLVRKLFDEHQISGWLTSVENKVELEVCLFDTQSNTNQLEFLETVDRKSKKYLKDSLESISIYPANSFYERTNQELLKYSPLLSDNEDHYQSYEIRINAWIDYDVKKGMDKVEARQHYINLRTKLKI
jgi:hypothetical protein